MDGISGWMVRVNPSGNKHVHQVTAWRRERERWSHGTGLNRRPAVYETAALPLSYRGFMW
jgi:hypothetical protein